MTFEELLTAYESYVQSVYDSHIPNGLGAPGTINRMESYIDDFFKKNNEIDNILFEESNRILNEVSSNTAIDTEKLKEEFFRIIQEKHNVWMGKHKPQ